MGMNQGAPLEVPDPIYDALQGGATLAISVSGGKDSQALLWELSALWRCYGFPGRLFAVHADLGRAEWPQTLAHVEAICQAVGVPLRVVRRKKGDLVARIEERLEKTRGEGASGDAPYWPSNEARFCTSHLKTDPIDSELRQFWPSSSARYCTAEMKRDPIDVNLRGASGVVISAEGVRADESPRRAKKLVADVRTRITAKPLVGLSVADALAARASDQRLGLNWRPILRWDEARVWRACGVPDGDLARRRAIWKLGAREQAVAGWPAHPAYVSGNQRLSCALCVLASAGDLTNGANENPALYRKYLELELRGGATFKHGQSLFDLPVSGEAARLRDELRRNTP